MLKKKHGQLNNFSPPEFPDWTSQGDSSVSENGDKTEDTDTDVTHSDLLKAFLNVKLKTQYDRNIEGGNTDSNQMMLITTTSKDMIIKGKDQDSATSDIPQIVMDTINILCTNIMTGCNETLPLILYRSLDNRDNSVETTSPITLKEDCLQCLASNINTARPATLLEICIDYMSWHSNVQFNCCMKLPTSASMKNLLVELMKVPHAASSDNRLVTLYNDLRVDRTVKDYLVNQVRKRDYVVVLRQIDDTIINSWKPRCREAWQDIDPYSDLEDVGSDTVPNPTNISTEEEEEEQLPLEVETPINRYDLHERSKCQRTSDRPVRQASANVSYFDTNDDLDLPLHQSGQN